MWSELFVCGRRLAPSAWRIESKMSFRGVTEPDLRRIRTSRFPVLPAND